MMFMDHREPVMDLSIVSSLYRSAPYLRDFHRRVSAAVRSLGLDYEIVLVNDGSPDQSLEIALELQRDDPRLLVVDLSRNFGHYKALMTGLAHSGGRRVFLLDSDLEEDPELLFSLSEAMDRTGADLVYGVQEHRKGGFTERMTGSMFYRLFSWLAAEEFTPNQLCARLMTRRYVDSLVMHRDREMFLVGLCTATGYQQVSVPAHKSHKGVSSYTLWRKISLAVHAITSSSNRPLEAIFYLGAILLVLSLVAAVVLIACRLFLGQILPGWASIMAAVSFLGGLNLFCIGIVGIYLAKIFAETKDRPYTVIRQVYPAAITMKGSRDSKNTGVDQVYSDV
jgi:putative glycosyltransferase